MSKSDKLHGHGKVRREGGNETLDEVSIARVGELASGRTAFVEAVIARDGWDLYENGDQILGGDEIVARLIQKYGYSRAEVPAAPTPDIVANASGTDAVVEVKTPAAADAASRFGGEIVSQAGVSQPAPAPEFTAANFLLDRTETGVDPAYLAAVGPGAENA
jgi:hypothetical protein